MTTNQEHAEVAKLLESQADLLVKSGTGQISIRDSGLDQVYQGNDRQLLLLAEKLGLSEPFPWRSLWDWYEFYSRNLATYAERRVYVSSQLRKAQDELAAISASKHIVVISLTETKRIVQRALADAEVLISAGQYSSVVDRTHTAVHGHLRWICDNYGISVTVSNPTITYLMKLIRQEHPSFARTATLDGDLKTMFMSMGNILDSLNNVRNNASLAHPKDKLLDEPEARLAINAAHTILNYVDDKTQVTPIEQVDD